MTDIVIVMTTVPTPEAADAIAQALIESHLAACVHILPPMTSVYRWNGQIARDVEQQVIVKTTAARVPAVRALLAERHPYELPECVILDVSDGSPEYLDWVRGETVAPRS